MHLLQYVKTHTALSMEFIVGFFIILVNVAFVAIMVWIILASASVLLHLHLSLIAKGVAPPLREEKAAATISVLSRI